MATTYITAALSSRMVPDGHAVSLFDAPTEAARGIITSAKSTESAVGHEDTARVMAGLLGIPVEARRVDVMLAHGDIIVVAEYTGPRLAEGATALPEGATLRFRVGRCVNLASLSDVVASNSDVWAADAAVRCFAVVVE